VPVTQAQAALGNPQLAASALQGGLGNSGLARQFPQFASHPDLSSQLLQQQVHMRALHQVRSLLSVCRQCMLLADQLGCACWLAV
jgi:hypothetical protein